MRHSRILGTGSHLPDKVLTNRDLESMVDTTDEWIFSRTGIRERRIAAEGETTSDLALAASRHALAAAGLKPGDIDLIVLATSTPDMVFPASACLLQKKLGIRHGAAFDVQAVCSGFVYALALADRMVATGGARNALVVGAEIYSRILDWSDRGTCVLFGDGAGAVLLRAEENGGTTADRGILSCHLHSDGRFGDILHIEGGAGSTGGPGLLRMAGKEVFRHAVTKLAAVVDEALAANGLTHADIRWLVPHQANARIIDAMGRKLNLPSERVVVTVDKHANTSAASIPLALNEARRDGRIADGDLVVMEAIGGGLTWGAALARF
jgi:3-oxoacyl-[acyl-carrier-protein] synthase-3